MGNQQDDCEDTSSISIDWKLDQYHPQSIQIDLWFTLTVWMHLFIAGAICQSSCYQEVGHKKL